MYDKCSSNIFIILADKVLNDERELSEEEITRGSRRRHTKNSTFSINKDQEDLD